MSSTALGAEKAVIFISDTHEKFYYEKLKGVRMAFNLYCNGTPSVPDYADVEEQVDECRRYRYGIRSTGRTTMICTPCSEDGIDVKSQAYGNKERY